jgi:predicted GNAT family acetyltransferase
MQIQESINGNEGRFYIQQDDELTGEVLFTKHNNHEIEIYHTEVAEKEQGHHVGEQLIEHAVDYARQNQLKITPSCTFAKAVFARNKSYQDVLA